VTLKRRLLLNVFTTSFAATLLQRGSYFFTHDVLGFSQSQNLWLALFVGVTYVGGASASHKLAARLGERQLLRSVLFTLALIHLGITAFTGSSLLVLAMALVAFLHGSMWPVFESYMSAGETPETLGRVLGRYNIGWALSVAPALAVAGALIASGSPRLLFVVAAALYSVVWLSLRAYPERPAHLAAGHAARPTAAVLQSYRALLRASRFAMILSYTLLYVLAPLMPELMKAVGFGVAGAARASGLLDVARLGSFLALFAFSGWHGRRAPIALAIVSLPLGFGLVLFGSSVPAMIAGECLFGGAAGFLYTAALYYAQVVENASVDAGGAHEALIGVGYALGPSAGLIGTALSHGAGPGERAYIQGMSVATLPLIVLCVAVALVPLVKQGRAAADLP
jgi:MFS family permease